MTWNLRPLVLSQEAEQKEGPAKREVGSHRSFENCLDPRQTPPFFPDGTLPYWAKIVRTNFAAEITVVEDYLCTINRDALSPRAQEMGTSSLQFLWFTVPCKAVCSECTARFVHDASCE
jgi:hypothetical protein